MHPHQETPQAVYIHIPFCHQRCHYCDFNTFALEGQPVDAYLQALEREMERTVDALPPGTISTVFVGGGTPTALTTRQTEKLMRMVRRYFPDRSDKMEFTVEANPGTTDPDKLAALAAGGVNRLSFGAQTFNDELLKQIGRMHDADAVERSLQWAREAGFGNLSIDLMFGLPNQTLADVETSLDRALSLELKHYSIYGLKVEERTLFHSLQQRGELPLPGEETEAEMFERIMRRLREAGFAQYEISNFAKPGYHGRHNLMYWHNRSYYGLGAGAHGYTRGIRHINVKGVHAYIEAAEVGLPRLEEEAVSETEAMEDFMMVGMRLLEGVDRMRFEDQFRRDMDAIFAEPIARLSRLGLIEATGRGYRLSEKGIPLGNEVFAEFVGTLGQENGA